MKTKILTLILLMLTVWMPGTGKAPAVVQAAQVTPSPADLIAAVNALRTSKGHEALKVDAALTAAAQAHAEYMSANTKVSSTGAGGTRPRDRALAAGYGGGETVFVAENVAMTQLATTLDTLINTTWADAAHWNTMTNPEYTHAGAGIAERGGSRYYTLMVGYLAGGATSYTPRPTVGPGTPQPTLPSGPVSAPVTTSTPLGDGSVFHVVQAGQAISTIAEAYRMPWEQLAAINNLDMEEPLIFEGQLLLVRPPFTPTVTATITQTPRAPTRTPRPSFTPRPTQPSPTPTVSATATAAPLVPPVALSRRNIGLGLILLSGLGLAGTIASHLVKQRKKGSKA